MLTITLELNNPAEIGLLLRALRRERDAWRHHEPDGQIPIPGPLRTREAALAVVLRQRLEIELAAAAEEILSFPELLDGSHGILERIREREHCEESPT